MGQKQTLLDHLKRERTITKLQALNKYGIMNAGERIRELRLDGHDIRTDMIEGKKPDGSRCEYAEYIYYPPEGKQINAFGQPKPQRNKAYSI